MGKRVCLAVLTGLLSLSVAGVAEGAGLRLDRSFSGDGRVVTGFGFERDPALRRHAREDRANAVAIGPDGRLVVAGTSDCLRGAWKTCSRMAVLRYRQDGSVDRDWGDFGKALFQYGAVTTAEDLAILKGGGVQVVGRGALESGSRSRLLLARVNRMGELDKSFADDGLKGIFFSNWLDYDVGLKSIAMRKDGDSVATGWVGCGSGCHQWMIVRVRPDGQLSPEFRSGKGLRYDALGNAGTPNRRQELNATVAVDRGGDLIIAGPSGAREVQVIRMRATGRLDRKFAGKGRTDLFVRKKAGKAGRKLRLDPQGVALDRDGSIYVAAGHETADGNVGTLFRLTAEGKVDRRFGNGKGYVQNRNLAFNDLEIDRCGRVVVGGNWSSGGRTLFGVARYSSRGKPDRGFGKTRRIAFPRTEDAYATGLQLFGRRVFLSGWTNTKPGGDEFATAALKMPHSAFRCGR